MRWLPMIVLVACVDPGDAQFSCPDGACPSGFHCWSDGLCHDEQEGDAGGVDAPIDIGLDVDDPDADDPDAPDAGPPRAVDLLLVIDDSLSMAPAQAQLAELFEPLVLGLVAGGFEDVTFQPITDLQIGIVSTDMGVGGYEHDALTGCNDSDVDREFGDDAVLRTSLDPTPGCASSYPAILSLDSSMTSAFIDAAACKVQLGTDGCGFEQPLEAMLKAITPQSAGPIFHASTRGHGDGANAGMVREDSVLALLILSDEEDCSAASADLFDPDADIGSIATRCIDHHATRLHAISRYVDGVRSLRPGQEDRIAFGALVGLPLDADPTDFDALLADPRMIPRLDGIAPADVCDGAISASAAPRVVGVADRLDDLGSRSVLESICVADYTPFLARFIGEIVDAL